MTVRACVAGRNQLGGGQRHGRAVRLLSSDDRPSEPIGEGNVTIISFVLATLVQFGPGFRFYQKGWPALLRRAPDMNSLVMLGTSAAYGYSVVATFAPEFLPAGTAYTYYEAGAIIVTLILLGRRAKGGRPDPLSKPQGVGCNRTASGPSPDSIPIRLL